MQMEIAEINGKFFIVNEKGKKISHSFDDADDAESTLFDWMCEMDNENPAGIQFADPGGNSALRAASPSNPRNLPCPTCNAPNRLTPADYAQGYQCDTCADRAEKGVY